MADRAPTRVIFVCWGNICRSPIAERVAHRRAIERGLTDIEFTSAATSSDELGAPMDPRAAEVLRRFGYRSEDHVAHRISAAELTGADLVIAMEDIHVRKLQALLPAGHNGDQIALLTDFDPDAEPGSGVPDPWYGPDSGFTETLSAIEAAMPGILDRAQALRSSDPRL